MASASLCVVMMTIALAPADAVPPTPSGTLKGQFVYDGPAPQPAALNAVRAGVRLALVDESLLVDAKTGGVKNMVVYVRTKNVAVPAAVLANVKANVEWNIRGGRLDPHVLSMMTTQPLVFRNNDLATCNVTATPLGDQGFNRLIPPAGRVPCALTRAQAIPQPVTDSIHPWVKGYVLPLGHPYVAVSNDDGTFVIKDLSPGTLEFQVWHEKVGYVQTADWTKGRFEKEIVPGSNDLGTIKLSPEHFKK